MPTNFASYKPTYHTPAIWWPVPRGCYVMVCTTCLPYDGLYHVAAIWWPIPCGCQMMAYTMWLLYDGIYHVADICQCIWFPYRSKSMDQSDAMWNKCLHACQNWGDFAMFWKFWSVSSANFNRSKCCIWTDQEGPQSRGLKEFTAVFRESWCWWPLDSTLGC